MKKVFIFLIILGLLLLIRGIILSIQHLVINTSSSDALTQNLKEEEKKNQLLANELWYVQSSNYIITQAREKLGFVRDGEQIIIAPTPQITPTPHSQTQVQENWQKWIAIFFKS